MPRGAADTDDVMMIPEHEVGEGRTPHTSKPLRYYYAKAKSNTRKTRSVKATPKITFTLEEFEQWAKQHPPVCQYCGTHDAEVQYLGHIDQNGNHVKTIGLDRMQGPDYTLDNICWSCILCNKSKSSDSYTYREMLDPAMHRARSDLHARRAARTHRGLIQDYWDLAEDPEALRIALA